jgi:hypothetical protein
MSYAGSAEAGSYLGPHGAIFAPDAGEVPPTATIRNFASVSRRSQPGVGMAAPAPAARKIGRANGNTAAGLALK